MVAHVADQRPTPSELVAAALEYAARGWPVFPVQPGGKRPLVAHGLHDATTDTHTIRRWWQEHPQANVAIRTGTAIEVCDVDGPDGWVALTSLGDIGDHTPVANTGRGTHIYYRAGRPPHRNRARWIDGCDWRGDGGYVVAPPSWHADTGRRYRWCVPPGDILPCVPDWIDAQLTPAAPTPVRPPAPVVPISPTITAWAAAALRRELDRVATAMVGTRNDTLNRAAFALGQIVAAGLLDLDHTRGHLLGAALTAGLDEREARATIQSGMRSGMQYPRGPQQR